MAVINSTDTQHLYLRIKILFVLSAVSYFFVISCFVLLVNLALSQDGSCRTGCKVETRTGVVPPQVTDDDTLVRDKRNARRHSRRRYDGGMSNSDGFFRRTRENYPAGPDDGYRWLTSYSRIPDSILREFCVKTFDMCNSTAGPPGPQGKAGQKGDRGDKGMTGEPGVTGDTGPEGLPGLTGIRGPPGESGIPGIPGTPGLDGRDGIPGEPGLDGVPGKDGLHGRSGTNGKAGTNGTPGINGTDGIPGFRGPPGQVGPRGPPGLPGPRGRKGNRGMKGDMGPAGTIISRYKNNTFAMAPTIIVPQDKSVITVKEDEQIQIRCEATGEPTPKVVWSRVDNKFIRSDNNLVTAIDTGILNIQQVSRTDIGEYLCEASNGIKPHSRTRIQLDVTFPPLIRIRNQHVGAVIGRHAVLQCFIEVYPTTVNHWVRGDTLIDSSWKYKMDETTTGYKVVLTLNITHITNSDYGMYACVSKNVRGKTTGTFTLFNQSESAENEPANNKIYIFGKEPKPKVVVKECPRCECDDILPLDCDSARGAYIKKMINKEPVVMSKEGMAVTRTWVTQAKRKRKCFLYQVGKPVFLRESPYEWGAWMLDPMATPAKENFYWSTVEQKPNLLFEYKDKKHFRASNFTKTYTLGKRQFTGNGHVIYNKAFFYHQAGTNNITRKELSHGKTISWKVEDMQGTKLYKSKHISMDLMTDDNGLWMIYGCQYSNNTMVMKVNPYNLVPEKIWNITLNRNEYGKMFIICGILYGVDSLTNIRTTISVAIDLYDLTKISTDIEWTNPYGRTTMISYNHRTEFLYSWDEGNQLEYILRLNSN